MASSFGLSIWANPLICKQNCSGSRSRSSNLRIRAASNFGLASKIIVRNLGYSVNESSLQEEFSKFGEIAEVKLVKHEMNRKPKAHALIQYNSQDNAILALENMDRKMFDGRVIYVEIAKPAGKHSFGGYPKASGPPKNKHLQEHDEVADCWY